LTSVLEITLLAVCPQNPGKINSACVFMKRFLRSENTGFPTSRRVIARMLYLGACRTYQLLSHI